MNKKELNDHTNETIAEMKMHWARFKSGEEKEDDAAVFADYVMKLEADRISLDGRPVGCLCWTVSWDDPSEIIRFYLTPEGNCFKAECWHGASRQDPHTLAATQDEAFFLEAFEFFREDGL
jgi:hypothetical protein